MPKKKKTKPASSPETTPLGTQEPEKDKVIPDDLAQESRLKTTHWEWIVLAITVVIGTSLRFYDWNSLAIEHFDEGVYASDIWFDADNNFQYPDRHLYAPPLLPELLEWTHILFGSTMLGAFGVSLYLGCLTVVLIWWVGRRWFGPVAGVSAALLLATNEIHILYSRTVLTEALFCFWFLLGVHCGWESLQKLLREKVASRSSQLWAVASGAAIGLCWLTKYNGWLPLAVLISGSVAFLIFSRATVALWKLVAGHLILIAAIAGLFFGPYVWSLQDVGGYASVAANHSQYFVGLSGWWNSFIRQNATLAHFDSWIGLCGVCLIPAILLGLKPGKAIGNHAATGPEIARQRISILAILIFVACVISLVPGIAIGLPTILLLVAISYSRFLIAGVATKNGNELTLQDWFLAAWLIGLLVAIPLYTPYPRLTVPLLIAGCLGVGAVIQKFVTAAGVDQSGTQPSVSKIASPAVSLAIAVSLLIIPIGVGAIAPNPTVLKPRFAKGSLPNVAHNLQGYAMTISQRNGFELRENIIYVYGEPAVFYHIRDWRSLAGPVGNLDFAAPGVPPQPVPVFLIVGPHADKSPLFKEQWEQYGDQFELIAEEKFTPSDFILLNDVPAWELRDPQNRHKFTQSLRLYKQKLK